MVGEEIKKTWSGHTRDYYSASSPKEKGDPTIATAWNEPGGHDAELNKPDPEGQILRDAAYGMNPKLTGAESI